MHIIKKYANRKLYHTNRKQYITLEGIAKLVHDGESVQVLDNETGAEITPSILAQVVLQSRGRNGPQLPATLLTGLIQVGGDTLASLRKTLFASLGGNDLIEEEIQNRIDQLVLRKDLSTDEADRLSRLLLQSEFAQSVSQQLAASESEMPSRNDVVRLYTQVDALAAIVEQLINQRDKK